MIGAVADLMNAGYYALQGNAAQATFYTATAMLSWAPGGHAAARGAGHAGAHLALHTGGGAAARGVSRAGLSSGRAAAEAVVARWVVRKGGAKNAVYLGIRDGKAVYVGITKNVGSREAEHQLAGRGFDYLLPIGEDMYRRQARAVEQTIIDRYGLAHQPAGVLENMINSIAPTRSWAEHARKWGDEWFEQHKRAFEMFLP